MKNKKYLYLLLLIVPIIVFFIGNAYSQEVEVKSVEIQSEDYDEPGSWHITKSAEWVDSGKARVTFDVNSISYPDTKNKDIIMILDVSGSMFGDKIERAKSDAIEIVNYYLADSNNNIALISFSDAAELKSGFTNNKNSMINLINNLVDEGNTNYNEPLLLADVVMEDYVYNSDREPIVLFLTDGFPNEDTPNEVATYQLLKDKYPYITINGIQYEMGNKIIQAIIDVSDNQWIADLNTLNNVLFNASSHIDKYENFVITDYINDEYFYIDSIDDVEVPFGEVKLEEENGVQKITWNLGNKYILGQNVKMYANLKLKEEYQETTGLYPTNKKEKIISKLPEENEKIEESTNTPILKNNLLVTYDYNPPTGCELPNKETEIHYPYQLVYKKTNEHTCNGYLFGGWQIVDDDIDNIKIINEDVFVMPTHNITLKANWKTVSIAKSMNGEVKGSYMTLYDIMRTASVPDDRSSIYVTSLNGIDFTKDASDTNGKGIYELRNSQVLSDAQDTPIYYLRGKVDNSYVLFGGFCWQIIRTTPDKGIKLIYADKPTGINNNQCNGTNKTIDLKKEWIPNYYSTYAININDGYTSYGGYMSNNDIYVKRDYDTTVNVSSSVSFKHVNHYYNPESNYTQYHHYYADSYTYNEETGEYSLVNPIQYNFENNDDFMNKYTFFSENINTTSKTIYYSLYTTHYYPMNSSYHYYETDFLIMDQNRPLSFYRNVPIGRTITKNNDGTYTISDITHVNVTNRYYSNSTFSNKYYCGGELTCEDPYYLKEASYNASVSASLYREFTTSKTIDGYNLVDPVTINMNDFITNNEYKDYVYYCSDGETNCNASTLKYVTQKDSYRYIYTDYTVYGKNAIWDGQYFNLVDTTTISGNNDYKFSCLDRSQTRCETVLYRLSNVSDYVCTSGTCQSYSKELFFKLQNGNFNLRNLFDKRKEVQVDENKNPINNSTNSLAKDAIDGWFKDNLLSYAKYLDDAVWCNERIIDESTVPGSFLTIGGTGSVRYRSYNRFTVQYTSQKPPEFYKPILKCEDKLDAFTVNDTVNGNGFLKYPVSLLTADEYLLSGISNSNKYITDTYWYTLSPTYVYSVNEAYMFQDGSELWNYGSVTRYMKPSIVLKPGIEVLDGDGTKDNPYKLDTNDID